MKIIIKHLILAIISSGLFACNGFFEKDNTPPPAPLRPFTQEIKPSLLWSQRAGSGVDEYLKQGPSVDERAVYTSSYTGTVTSINRINGNINWQVTLGSHLSTAPGIGEGLVIVGSRKGEVYALSQANGNQLWQVCIPGEMLAKPAIGHGHVIIKTTDGYVRALSLQNGHEIWAYQEVEPSLILRGASSPLIKNHSILAGFANGNLVKLTLDGNVQWVHMVAIPDGAFAIQRMIDIDADPVIFDHSLYAATYQGKIASLDWTSGRTRWSYKLSSYTGMSADDCAVYVSDAQSFIWSFNADNGAVNWRQDCLAYRIVSGPAVFGQYVVVGDAEGYLHWLNKSDGHFAARESIGSPIYAAPVVKGNILYALSSTGYLVAYALG